MPSRPALACVGPSPLPYLDGRGADVVWRSDDAGADSVTTRCLTSSDVSLVIGKGPFASALATIPLEGFLFRYEIRTRADADAAVLEYVDFIAEAYREHRDGGGAPAS